MGDGECLKDLWDPFASFLNSWLEIDAPEVGYVLFVSVFYVYAFEEDTGA